jgi:hypothetical protein
MRHPVHLDLGRPAAEVLQPPLQAPLAPGPPQAPQATPRQNRDPRRHGPARTGDPRRADDRSRPCGPPRGGGGNRPPHPLAGGPDPGLTAGPACPHCRKPVALVAWLVPPAAATVKEPPRHADTVRDNS